MHNPIRVERNELSFGSQLRVTFQRTLRVPDDGRRYPLPPGLGSFPLRRVDDYLSSVPDEWRGHGGVFLPMYQREAMWICFRAPAWRPCAIKVGVGKICAITGERWSERLQRRPQDYVVAPPQPWLDGIASGRGFIRQFVAMPLGMGYTVEGQVSGEERFGGVQLKVFEPRAGRFPDTPPSPYRFPGQGGAPDCCHELAAAAPASAPAPRGYGRMSRTRGAGSMGLAAGGRMRQKIYPDPHGIDTWDPHRSSRTFVHIVNSELWREITGEPPPSTPVTAREYSKAGLPWFDLYDEGLAALSPSGTLSDVKSVKELDAVKFPLPIADDEPVDVGSVKGVTVDGAAVRDGDW